jgi:hypothetical protein
MKNTQLLVVVDESRATKRALGWLKLLPRKESWDCVALILAV